MRRFGLLLVALTVGAVGGCTPSADAKSAQAKSLGATRQAALNQRKTAADANPGKDGLVGMWVLPTELREISGLAIKQNGQLLAHGDEVANIYVIDPRTGIVTKKFRLRKGVSGDFEAITVAGQDIYLLESNGRLYKFREGAENAHVDYRVIDTKLGKECEFEGLVYEPDSARLVMPCKRVNKKNMRDQLMIYRLPLQGSNAGNLSVITIPASAIIGSNDWKGFQPSDITIDPATGNYVLISSIEKGIAVITPDGEVVRSGPLPGKHGQPEGVAITTDSLLIISDEAGGKPAAITLYRWRQ